MAYQLGARGTDLYDSVIAQYTEAGWELTAQEDAVLIETCKILDTIDALDAEIEAKGVMIPGSKGQQIINPAIAERRLQQAAFGNRIATFKVPEPVGGGQKNEGRPALIKPDRIRSAEQAAAARWTS